MELQFAHALHGFDHTPKDQPLSSILHAYSELSLDVSPVESAVWSALQSWVGDAEHTKNKLYRPETILSGVHPKRLWSVPHRVLLQYLCASSETLRRAVLVLRWLEDTSPPFQANINTSVRGWKFSAESGTGDCDGVDAKDLDARDKSHEEILLEALLRYVRQGDLRAASALAAQRGMPWRCAILETVMAGGGDASNWLRNTEGIPLFGEYRDGVTSPAASDQHRGRVLSTLHRTLHSDKDVGQRYKALQNALHGVLCGNLQAVMPSMGNWRDQLWAVLRCHVTLILMRYVLDVTGSAGMHESFIYALNQYGGGQWKDRAEEMLLQSTAQCAPESFASDMDELSFHVSLGILTAKPIHFSRALEVCATRVSVSRPVFAMHFADVLSQAFAQGYTTADVQRSQHYTSTLRSYWCHTLPLARTSNDVALLHHAPLYFMCNTRDATKRTNDIAEYLAAVRQQASSYMEPHVLEEAQERALETVAQILCLRTHTQPDEALAAIREAIASKASAPPEAVLWLSLAVAPVHSERALRQALKELRVHALRADGLETSRSLLNVTEKKVMPQYEVRLASEPDVKVLAALTQLQYEIKMWSQFVRGAELARTLLEPEDSSTSQQVNIVSPTRPTPVSNYAALMRESEEVNARQELYAVIDTVTGMLGEFSATPSTGGLGYDRDTRDLIPKIIPILARWCRDAVLHSLNSVTTVPQAEASRDNYLDWVSVLERSGMDTFVPSDVLLGIVNTAADVEMHMLRKIQLLNT